MSSYDHTWQAGDLYHELKRLNPDIRISPSRLTNKVNGVYVRKGTGRKYLCAIDRNTIPFFPIYDSKDRLVRIGARDVLNALVINKVLTRTQVRNLYPGFFEMNRGVPFLTRIEEDSRGEKARKAFNELAQPLPESLGYNEDLHQPKPVSMSSLADLTKELNDTSTDDEKAAQDVRNFERTKLLKA